MEFLKLASAAICFAAVGCVTAEEGSVDTMTQSIATSNRLAVNRIAVNRLAANRIAVNRIAVNRIAANRIAVNRIAVNGAAADLIETEDGREVFKYLAECAIPVGTTLVATDSQGVAYEFDGAIGLAPRWLDHALNERESRWISACLFSRVNAHNISVEISLRGPSRALDVTLEESAEWTLEEGAFYGQYFLPITQPIAWYACSGRRVRDAHDRMRDCANPDPDHPGLTMCGFTYAGECGVAASPSSAAACESQSLNGTYYRDCSTGDVFTSEDDSEFSEVITTFVHP